MDKVVLLTVTYNSSQYLARLLEAASCGSYPLYRIVCADNGSSGEHARRLKELREEYESLILLGLGENTGGAGGFEAGFRYVLGELSEADWVWVMDDDAFPREDSLERLLAHKDIPGLGALAPLIFGNERQAYQLYHHKRLSRLLDEDLAVIKSEDELALKAGERALVPIEANAFVGPLIRLSAAREIGVPDGSLFIYGDDTEYTYRLSRRYGFYLAPDAVVNHRDVFTDSGVRRPRDYWKDYYAFRNRYLLIRKYKRNAWEGLMGSLKVTRRLLGALKATLLDPAYKGRRALRLSCLLRGFFDGLLGRSGKRLDPASYRRYE